MYELRHYVDQAGDDLFAQWLDKLTDRQARARIAARLTRLQNGNFGDCKFVGDGVWELRVDWVQATVFTTLSKVSVLSCCVKVGISERKRLTLQGQLFVGMNGKQGEGNESYCST